MDQMSGAAVEGNGVDDGGAGTGESEECGHDGRHSGIENGRLSAAGLERHDLVFQDFRVGVRDAGVNEIGFLVRFHADPAAHDGESALGRFGSRKDVGGAAENSGTR